MHRKIMILQRTSQGIVAIHLEHNGTPDREVRRLFGTHILPTAYTQYADLDKVYAAIKALNPNKLVVVD